MKKWHKIFREGPVLVSSPEAMKDLGLEIGKLLESGEVLALVGNLGAGKTHLTQGIIAGLGDSGMASSPTFSLVHEHTGGRLPAYHFDFYRLKNECDLNSAGWEDYVDREGVIVVEWADMFPHLIPMEATWLLIQPVGETERTVDIKFYQA